MSVGDKAVLLSIKPRWVSMIAAGKKTVEVRKTRPRIDTPFKCYIYQTLPKSGDWNEYDGRIIGTFICDSIKPFDVPFPAYWDEVDTATLKDACMTYAQAHDYFGHRSGFAWHINDLVIYDKPKELNEFYKWYEDGEDIRPCQNGKHCKYEVYDYSENCQACAIDFDGTDCPFLRVTRPPQSWCYVEELP